MVQKNERFLAALLRDGEKIPFDSTEVEALDWAHAADHAKIWASKKVPASGAVSHPTSLFLKQGVASVIVVHWNSPEA